MIDFPRRQLLLHIFFSRKQAKKYQSFWCVSNSINFWLYEFHSRAKTLLRVEHFHFSFATEIQQFEYRHTANAWVQAQQLLNWTLSWMISFSVKLFLSFSLSFSSFFSFCIAFFFLSLCATLKALLVCLVFRSVGRERKHIYV